MATPLNTTDLGLNDCVRQSTQDNQLTIKTLPDSSGVCPGTQASPGHYRCCGLDDTCLGYGVCHHNNPTNGRSAFYIAGCNNPSYNDEIACPKICVTQARPDVMWDADLSVWRCCGTSKDGHVECDEPSQYAFRAPTPDELLRSSSNDTVNGQGLGTTPIKAVDISTLESPSSSNGLSAAAKAGIAAGAIVPVVLLAVIAFFWFQRRKAQRRKAIEMRHMQWVQ